MFTPSLDYFPAQAEQPPLEERAALVGEIAERLIELEELHNGTAADLVFKLAQVFQLSPVGFRYALEGLRGNTAALTASWGELANTIGAQKQTHHAAFNVAIRSIRTAFPELADTLERIRYDALSKDPAPNASQAPKIRI